MTSLRCLLLILTLVSIMAICNASPRHVYRERNGYQPNFCRKYVYAPRCRGAGAKRDLQKLEPLLEDPRSPQDGYPKEYQNNKFWPENDINDRRLLDTLVNKLSAKATDEHMNDYM